MSIGQRLRAARKERGLSQSALAEKIGASRGVVTNIEHDKVDEPQIIVIKALCDALSIRELWLLTGDGCMEYGEQSLSNGDIATEINTYVQELSKNEQLYILDTIKTYIAHLKD